MMIWTTAKFTEVKSRHRRIPARAGRLGATGSGAARPSDRSRDRIAASIRPPRPSGRGRCGGDGPSRRKPAAEVLDEVLDVLEADADAQKAGRDPPLDELRLRQLAPRGRRRVDHHRVDAAEGRRELGDSERVDERPAGIATADDLEREHPAAVAGA